MLVAAVDGGGTKTRAVIVDKTCAVLSEHTAGCGNHQVCGLKKSIENVALALRTALQKIGKTQKDIAFVQYSLAGADRDADVQLLSPHLRELGFPRWGLTSDAWSSLRLGTYDGRGIGIVCGTGTNAVGVNGEGVRVQIGGFGYLFGDRAGGEELARTAFHTAVRSFEGREAASVLTELIPQYFSQTGMPDLIQYALDEEWQTVPSGLAETVHVAAAQGDAVSVTLLRQMGTELGNAAVAVFRKLETWPVTEVVPVVLTGSILQKGRNKDLLSSMAHVIEQTIPSAEVRIPVAPPVMGALMMACDSVGWPSSSPEWETVAELL